MFQRNKQFIRNDSLSASLFVESNDVQNSEFYYMLDNCPLRKTYQVTKYEHRLDLISLEIYDTVDYAWVLQYLNRVSLDEVIRGKELEYIPKSELLTLLSIL